LAGALCDQGVIIVSQIIDRQCGNQRAIPIRILVRDFRYARQDLDRLQAEPRPLPHRHAAWQQGQWLEHRAQKWVPVFGKKRM
jgi:propanediol utilization protein